MGLFLIALYLFGFLTVKSIIIDTNLGKIEGKQDQFGGYTFKNIPYAEPPINELRWKPTKPLTNTWNGVYNATAPGNACIQPNMQVELMIVGSNGIMSEDCLTLGIQTPFNFNQSQSEKLRNVLVWIHGGGLTSGTGYSYTDGSLANNQDIVIVSINYRLGVGAWLVNPLLYNDDSTETNGGANGFLDMIEALKWVKNNIKDYGGNPNEITIAGESGGGMAVCGLLISPLSRGLFKRSIQMSGTCIESMGKFFSEEEAWKSGKIVRDVNNATTFNDLYNMDLQNITDNFIVSIENDFLPSIDGYVFPINTLDLMKNGNINGESTMIGTVFRESFTEKPFYMGSPPQSLQELNEYYYAKLFDYQAQLIQQYYPVDNRDVIWPYGISEFDNNYASLIQTVQTTDCWVKCGSIWQIDILSTDSVLRNSFPIYFYQYGYIRKPWDQVSHGYDIIGLFGIDWEWISGGVEYSEEFTKITQQFFGNYINGGIVPKLDNGNDGSVQNGYYYEIVDKVKIVNIEKLNFIRDRCEVYKLLGDNIWRHKFCMGIFFGDDGMDFETTIKNWAKQGSDDVDDNQDKQEI